MTTCPQGYSSPPHSRDRTKSLKGCMSLLCTMRTLTIQLTGQTFLPRTTHRQTSFGQAQKSPRGRMNNLRWRCQARICPAGMPCKSAHLYPGGEGPMSNFRAGILSTAQLHLAKMCQQCSFGTNFAPSWTERNLGRRVDKRTRAPHCRSPQNNLNKSKPPAN